MTDLYAVLGLGRNAKPTQIKSAYRKKAKAAHPDHGGSAQAFADLNRAYKILSDAALRTKYDETGEIDPLQAENADGPALNLINAMLAQVLAHDQDFIEVDLIGAMSDAFAKEIASHKKVITTLKRVQTRARRMQGHFKPKKDTENRFDPWLDWHVNYAAEKIRENEAHVAHRKRAVSILSGYTFQSEARQGQYGTTSASSSFTFSY